VWRRLTKRLAEHLAAIEDKATQFVDVGKGLLRKHAARTISPGGGRRDKTT